MNKSLFVFIMLAIWGVACAAPIRSMLGARDMGDEEEAPIPSAAEYVQDGLVAMWDAIENAGYGEHDPYSFTVVNLADSDFADITLPADRWIIEDNHIVSTTNTGIWVSYPTIQWYQENMLAVDGYTAEIVCTVSKGYKNYPNILSIAQGCGFAWNGESVRPTLYSFSTYAGNSGVGTSLNSGSLYAIEPKDFLHRFSLVCTIGINTYFYVDNYSNMFAKGGLTGDQYFPSRNRIFIGCDFWNQINANSQNAGWEWGCVRIYNRALTSEEVAHNYFIDQKRFNLQ